MKSNLLNDQTAVITGCSRGIGRSILENFALNGANCIACVRKKDEEFVNFCKDLSSKYKVNIDIVAFDLGIKKQVIEGAKKILEISKRVTVLVNNGGILFNSLFQMTSEKQLRDIFEINFFSHIFLTQLISREMAKNRFGSIIFISSTSAKRNDIGRFAYSSTKAAISSTARVLAKELGPYKIRVNSICPGLTLTDMSKKNTREDFMKEEIKKSSLKRLANPEESKNCCFFSF